MDVSRARTEVAQWVNEVGGPIGGGFVVSDADASLLLVELAVGEANTYCTREYCDTCNTARLVFWEMMASMGGPSKIKLQRILRECGIPLPAAPLEEVYRVVPTAQR